MNYRWPALHPEGCPPDSAAEAQGVFFRFVRNDPPTAEDFKRPIELPRQKPPQDDELCSLYALSLLRDEADVQLFVKYVPGMKKKKVARGALAQEMGVILNTPAILSKGGEKALVVTSHFDWWIPEDYEDQPNFEVVTL